jgi:hypothetical protein
VFSYAETFSVAVTAILADDRRCARTAMPTSRSWTRTNRSGEPGRRVRQQSDDAFAKYLYYSKGSIAEVMRRLPHRGRKGHVLGGTGEWPKPKAEELGRCSEGFIKYLKQSGFQGPRPLPASQASRLSGSDRFEDWRFRTGLGFRRRFRIGIQDWGSVAIQDEDPGWGSGLGVGDRDLGDRGSGQRSRDMIPRNL